MSVFRVEKFPNWSKAILLDSSQSYRIEADTPRLAARRGLLISLRHEGLIIRPDTIHSHQVLVSHWPDQNWSSAEIMLSRPDEKYFFYIAELMTDKEYKAFEEKHNKEKAQ